MDRMVLGMAAATLLAANATETPAHDRNAELGNVVTRLHSFVRDRFADDGEVQGALDALEGAPSSEARKMVVAEVLEDRARSYPDFGAELEHFVTHAQRAGGVIVTNIRGGEIGYGAAGSSGPGDPTLDL